MNADWGRCFTQVTIATCERGFFFIMASATSFHRGPVHCEPSDELKSAPGVRNVDYIVRMNLQHRAEDCRTLRACQRENLKALHRQLVKL